MEKSKHTKLPRLIDGHKLIKRWNINDFELAEFVRNGILKAYRPSTGGHVSIFDRPERLTPDQIAGCIFYQQNVEQFEKDYPEVLSEGARPQSEKDETGDKGPVPLEKDEYLKDPVLIELVRKAKPEIELIYKAMRKKVGFSGNVVDIEIKLQNEAISTFTHNKDKFKFIKGKYLEDPGVYELNPGQSKRDFVGRLLGKVVEEHTGKPIGGQELYNKLYKKIENFSTNLI